MKIIKKFKFTGGKDKTPLSREYRQDTVGLFGGFDDDPFRNDDPRPTINPEYLDHGEGIIYNGYSKLPFRMPSKSSIKAFTVTMLVILLSTVGLYYLGYYNIVPLSTQHAFLEPTVTEGVMLCWFHGLITLVFSCLVLVVGAFFCWGIASMYHALKDRVKEIHLAGDAHGIRRVHDATREGAAVGRLL